MSILPGIVYDRALCLNKAYLTFFTIWPLNEKLACEAKILRVEMFVFTIRGNHELKIQYLWSI